MGLKYEELSSIERETLNNWLESLQKGQLSLEKVKEYVASMRNAVENEIASEPSFTRIFIFKVENPKLIQLQARLKNYLLLDSFLSSPEKARQQMENALASMTSAKQAN